MSFHKIVVMFTAFAVAVTLSACADSRPRSAADAVGDLPPVENLVVWADAEPDSGEPPLVVQLSCDPLEDIESPSYSWDPGDGSEKIEGQTVKHTYARAGQYTARVVVRDKNGNIGNDEVMIEIEKE